MSAADAIAHSYDLTPTGDKVRMRSGTYMFGGKAVDVLSNNIYKHASHTGLIGRFEGKSVFVVDQEVLPLGKTADWATSGVSGVGASDASASDPNHEQRKEDNASRAFDVNKNQVDMPEDVSSSIGEPGTIPHAYKIAAALRTQAAELACGDLASQLPFFRAKRAAAVSAPVAPPAMPAAPKISTKPVQAFDPRTDKPAGMNLMNGIQTMSNGADVGASYSSFSRRLQGSPV